MPRRMTLVQTWIRRRRNTWLQASNCDPIDCQLIVHGRDGSRRKTDEPLLPCGVGDALFVDPALPQHLVLLLHVLLQRAAALTLYGNSDLNYPFLQKDRRLVVVAAGQN